MSRFEYVLKNSNSIWEKITVQGSVITFYYRILRGREGQTKDEALFAVAPVGYDYVFDQQPKHEGLHSKTGDNAFEHLWLHRHIDCKAGVTSQVLSNLIAVFRQLEPVCAQKGQYTLGQYVFMFPTDEEALMNAFSQYLKTNQPGVDSDIPKSQSSNASPAITPSYTLLKHTAPNKGDAARKLLAERLGESFMRKHGESLSLEESGDYYHFTITLPLKKGTGEAWFLKKIRDCQFTPATEGQTTVRMTVQIVSGESLERTISTVEKTRSALV